MGTKVAVTLDSMIKPDYVVSTQAAIAFAVAAGELVLWIGGSHGQGKHFEVTAIRKCLDAIRDMGATTPTSSKHSYAKIAAPGYTMDASTGANVADTTLLTGTVSVTINTKAVVGVGTTFLTDLVAGGTILIGTQYCVIDAIASDTALTIVAVHAAGASGADYYNVVFSALTGTMTITAGTDAVLGVGTEFEAELTAGESVLLLEGEYIVVTTVTDDENLVLAANHVGGAAETALTGTVSVTLETDAVVGVGTDFENELVAGSSVMKIGTEYIVVETITDAENLVLASAHQAGASGATAYLAPTGQAGVSTLMTGTVSVTSGQKAVTGVGTTFLTDLSVGDVIKIGAQFVTVTVITSDLALTISEAHVAGASAVAYYISNVPSELDVGIWYGDLFQQSPGSSITPHALRALEKYLESTQKADG